MPIRKPVTGTNRFIPTFPRRCGGVVHQQFVADLAEIARFFGISQRCCSSVLPRQRPAWFPRDTAGPRMRRCRIIGAIKSEERAARGDFLILLDRCFDGSGGDFGLIQL
ncbi:hypothetical protein PR202_gb16305 [Eleusine coracana subsp. coracana]|uniref:Uncharacterized protein n=1 Tax=Eleusine coracana subsp. coracana TaxID=191504 RepID=A0AAV5F0J6_ELECO|nr:hypothetical protein PR202_gb16305 [Eleusine coracana subsp. coracana]